MTTPTVAALLNLLGYVTGTALYAMLLAMALGEKPVSQAIRMQSKSAGPTEWPNRLPLLTAVLGLAWNIGALIGVGLPGLSVVSWQLPLINAAAFTALGFLPAVVVHALLRTNEGLKTRRTALRMTIIAYTLSALAGLLHVHHAIIYQFAPSHWALHILTIGFIAIIVALLFYTHRKSQTGEDVEWKGAGWAVALAIFAVSALHLSHHEGQDYSWWIELIGHHASLPLALTILYQDYRFALADIFLKRALSLVLLVAMAFGLYLAAAPLLKRHHASGEQDALAIGLLLGLWVATALIYPLLRRMINRFVDSIVLRRADYETVRAQIAQSLALKEAPEDVLDEVCQQLSAALTARDVSWTLLESNQSGNEQTPSGPLLPRLQLMQQRSPAKRFKENALRLNAELNGRSSGEHEIERETEQRALAIALVPTTELPQYRLLIAELAGGRRLLSDDLALIEAASVLAARRIDAVRVVHERCVRDLHEEEMHKLATQAELRALRAQINPHFLFNSLTTIGYLIQTAPDRALDTLMRLTNLLRGVLRHSDGEFTTLGAEIDLIESYLEIERARFEDRLRVMIDVPDHLRSLRIPALLLQPLVENAIKHGISPLRAGGEVVILARLARGDSNRPVGLRCEDDTLQIWVRDTGAGTNEQTLVHGRRRGVGLANVEQRIKRHFGEAGTFHIRSAHGIGTTVELGLPIHAGATHSDKMMTARGIHA